MKKIKKVILWCISIFFILSSIVYIGEIWFPALLLLIAGISIIPPVNEKIKGLINDEEKVEKYKILRNVLIIVFFLIFMVNVPTTTKPNEPQAVNTINNVNVETNTNTEEEKSSNEITEKYGKYTGDIVDGKKQGNGKFEWNSGAIYEGEFSNNEINGNGKMIIPTVGEYQGSFVNGKRSGKGKYIFTNGDIYDGEWTNDKMNGQGVYTFANGDKYEGQFSNNKFNGTGTYTKDGKQYTGTWKDNEYKK